MANGKKSFLLYCDLIHTVEKLPDDKAGLLLKHILKYVNDLNPITEDMLIDICFEPIKQQLKRDLRKYESIIERNTINGAKGGRPKNPKKPKEPTGLIGNPKKPKEPDSVSVSVSVNDNGNVKEDIKEKIEEREELFKSELKNHKDKYSREMLSAFFNYWKEPNRSKTKMRFELEGTWSTPGRLSTWYRRETK